MSTIYRSPNIIIDDDEWHLLALAKDGRLRLKYCFRPYSSRPQMWRPIVQYPGHLPKNLAERFAPYRKHADKAVRHEQRRRALLSA